MEQKSANINKIFENVFSQDPSFSVKIHKNNRHIYEKMSRYLFFMVHPARLAIFDIYSDQK